MKVVKWERDEAKALVQQCRDVNADMFACFIDCETRLTQLNMESCRIIFDEMGFEEQSSVFSQAFLFTTSRIPLFRYGN